MGFFHVPKNAVPEKNLPHQKSYFGIRKKHTAFPTTNQTLTKIDNEPSHAAGR
jgi:hypothetical protein